MLQGIRWESSCLYCRGHVTCVSRGEEKQLLPDILNCSGEAKDQTKINMQTQVSAVFFFIFFWDSDFSEKTFLWLLLFLQNLASCSKEHSSIAHYFGCISRRNKTSTRVIYKLFCPCKIIFNAVPLQCDHLTMWTQPAIINDLTYLIRQSHSHTELKWWGLRCVSITWANVTCF